MSPLACKLVGTLFIAIGVFGLLFRLLGGPDVVLLPWPVAAVVVVLGLLLLRAGGGLDGWKSRKHREVSS